MNRVIVLAISVALLAIPSVGSSSAVAAKPKCGGLVATKVGTNKSQVIRGTPRRDVIVAKGGVDRIYGEGGNDVICAGPGNDIIEGGPGKDRIFGEGGNDVLKGGPGKDFLDGGAGRNACYPAAGGDKLRNCEDADLAVDITIVKPSVEQIFGDDEADAVADDNEAIEFTVRVRNLGAKRSGPFDLTLSQVQTGITCGVDHSGTTSEESLWPGAFFETVYVIKDGCTRAPATGVDPELTITATVEPASADADQDNDEASVRIDIRPPVTLPAP